ncbi:MAG: Asp-tRNA(Asn)/Glu-tRNA(Gln) amidotransferase subunit GatC [Chloroflexota bacterium]
MARIYVPDVSTRNVLAIYTAFPGEIHAPSLVLGEITAAWLAAFRAELITATEYEELKAAFLDDVRQEIIVVWSGESLHDAVVRVQERNWPRPPPQHRGAIGPPTDIRAVGRARVELKGRAIAGLPAFRFLYLRCMALTRGEMDHLALLARLGLTDDEKDRMAGQLGHILAHMERLNRLDTSQVAPSAQVIEVTTVLRADEAGPSLDRARVLANAPRVEEPFLRVPPVFE